MDGPSPAAALQRALASADAEERRQATARLPALDAAAALPLLTRALGDEDWRVRKEATLSARALAPAPGLLEALVGLLAPGDNVGLRNAAVEALSAIGPAATAALAAALPGLDADGRKLAVEALGRSRDPAALGALEGALRDPDDNVREGAIEAIASLGAVARERVPAILLEHLDDRDGLVRLVALEGLRALDVPIPWGRLAPLIDEPTLRCAALSAAALTESPEAPAALARALSEARGTDFSCALASLARLAEGPLAARVAATLRAAGEPLAARLVALAGAERAPLELRAMALGLAARAGLSGAVEAGLAALSVEALAGAAQQALGALGGDALPVLVAAVSDEARDPGARAVLVEVAVGIAREAAAGPLPGLTELLGALRAAARDEDKGIATSALFGLSRLGGAEDLQLAAEQALSDARPASYAAESALATLAARYPGEARALARELMNLQAFYLPAAIVLGATASFAAGAPPAAPPGPVPSAGGGPGATSVDPDLLFLAHAAAAGDVRARRAAVAAVAEMGGAWALEVLSVALADEEHEVRLAAARALGRLSSGRASSRPAAPSARDVLALVERLGTEDLTAATVRALGEGIRAASGPPPQELFDPLVELARRGSSAVAMAAVDALGRLAATAAGAGALGAALDHPDPDVVRSALLKLADPDARALARGLDHPSAAVRLAAAEVLADTGTAGAHAYLAQRAPAEPDLAVRAVFLRALADGASSPAGER